MRTKAQLDNFLSKVVELNVSDVIFSVGRFPDCRKGNELIDYKLRNVLKAEDTVNIANILLSKKDIDWDKFHSTEVSYETADARFRASIYKVRQQVRIVMRIIPTKIRLVEELSLPEQIKNIARLESGLVLIAGKTRQGKSTTIAAIVEEINRTRQAHIITLESPIECIYEEKLSIISQCEVEDDIKDYPTALRAALRQSPDVIMIGEIRDASTFEEALTAAETGHLVLSTIHTNTVQTTLDRMLAYYPQMEKAATASRLSHNLQTIIVQRLLPRNKQLDSESQYDLIPAVEIFHMSAGIRQFISSGEKLNEITNYMEGQGKHDGMQSFDMHIKELYEQGLIDMNTLKAHATNPEQILAGLNFDRGF
ncbi:MAG: ATPase, T2SS/T4P/T4SS family [Blastocatellia bacterium]